MANSVYHLDNPTIKGDVVDESWAMLNALGLGMKILEYAKVRSWNDLNGHLPPRLCLTDSQADLVRRYENLCALQRAKTDDGVRVTVCVCSECSRWMLVASGGTKPSKCSLTLGCTGTVMSPPSTKKVAERPSELDLPVQIEPEEQAELDEPSFDDVEPEVEIEPIVTDEFFPTW